MLLKIILESNVTLNISRSSDSFSAVPTIVNEGHRGCIVRDLETIILLLAFNFILQMSRLSLTMPRSQLKDPVTTILMSVDGTGAIKVESLSL